MADAIDETLANKRLYAARLLKEVNDVKCETRKLEIVSRRMEKNYAIMIKGAKGFLICVPKGHHERMIDYYLRYKSWAKHPIGSELFIEMFKKYGFDELTYKSIADV